MKNIIFIRKIVLDNGDEWRYCVTKESNGFILWKLECVHDENYEFVEHYFDKEDAIADCCAMARGPIRHGKDENGW